MGRVQHTNIQAGDLRASIFGTLRNTPGGALEDRFSVWAGAARFRAFAYAHRDKVRKKLRLVPDEEGLRDLGLELEIAARLLRDRRFTVEYEKQATSGRRYPDLTVTFRARTILHLEVKRVRVTGADPEAKCADVICDGVQQLIPNALNALAIGLPAEPATVPDLVRAMRALRARAERKDDAYFQRRAFGDAREFLRSFERLSALVMIGARGAQLEINPLARRPMLPDISRALGSALGVP